MQRWMHEADKYLFAWDLEIDQAEVVRASDGHRIWCGSLLPLFRLTGGQVLKAEPGTPDNDGNLPLRIGDRGTGLMRFHGDGNSVWIDELSVEWSQRTAIHSVYFGAAILTDEQRQIVPSLELPFWPNWSSGHFCIPSAKGAPVQSFFRSWDFGHADLPLGSFGPSLGTPYAAAYPRPLYAAAAGDDCGWVALGPGSVPDAALQLQIRSSTAMLQWLYREDLWGSGPKTRHWSHPLRMSFGATALEAYATLFDTFPRAPARPGRHARTNINSWGSFCRGLYDLQSIADRASLVKAEVLVIDQGWETADGTAEPALTRFPRFMEDLEYIREKGLAIGFWQSAGWIGDPDSVGLSNDDLILGADGKPRRVNWSMSPHARGPLHYCLDPAAPGARQFIINRTVRLMRELKPSFLKLDFAYGLPGPDVGVSREPALRGERTGWELLRLIVDAARSVDPEVTIQYYGLHPLLEPICDLVALDDLGDAGNWEREGHAEWSIWSTLAGRRGTPVMASSGYDWEVDSDILLNTAIIGVSGCVLPLDAGQDQRMTADRLLRRQALARWCRRSREWWPLWADSEPGSAASAPHLQTWGRIERIAGQEVLTSVALRKCSQKAAEALEAFGICSWTGRWALIAQTDEDLASTARLACIPLDEQGFLTLRRAASRIEAVREDGASSVVWSGTPREQFHLDYAASAAQPLLGYLVFR